ncbi:MAG: TolC family protein [Flavobacteriales bacterium]
MKRTILISLFALCGTAFAQNKIWSLKDCINYAMDNNLSLERSKLNLNSAEYDKKISKFDFLPNLNGNASQGFSFGRAVNPTTNEFITSNISNLSFQVNSNVTIFNAGRLQNTFKLNKAQVKSSEYALKELENDISLNIANAFLQILFQKELLETSEQQLELSKSQLERMKIRFQNGLESNSKLLEVESQFYTDQQSKQTAYFNLQNSRLNLFQLLDIQDYENNEIEIPTIETPETIEHLSVSQIFNNSKQHLPQYKKIEADKKVSQLNTKVTRAAKLPTLTLGAGLDSRASKLLGSENIATKDQLDANFSQNVNLNLSVPIFNKFRNNINIQKSKLRELQVNVDEKELNNKIYKDIQSSMFNAQSAYEAFKTSQKAYASSSESYNNANERYKLALLSYYDFQQSKNTLFAAKSKLIQAKYDYIFKTMILKFYQGHPITLN